MWPLFSRSNSEHLLFRSDRIRCSAARYWLRKPVLEPLEDRLAPSVALVVNSLIDNTDLDGVVTLREALLAANTNTTVGDAVHDGSGGIDTITFDPMVFSTPQTITLAMGELPVTDSV